MKKEILTFVCFMLISFGLFAQKEQITLTFSGVNSSNQTVTVDSVVVENVTQVLGETVYYPNLSITLEYEAGIGNNSSDVFKGSMVYPNPFQNYSIISVNNPENQEVSISVIDNVGRLVCETRRILSKGVHNFRFNGPHSGSYNIIISNEKQKSALKAISFKEENSNNPSLEYTGQGTIIESGFKTTGSITTLPYQQGDVLRFTGYAAGYPDVSITDSPTANKNYQLEFSQFFRLSKQLVETETPCFVNIMFQVTDENHIGVDNLTTESFIVKEDNQPVSPTETFMYINKMSSVPYQMKTVLLLDNSASVAPNLEQIKTAAINLVNNIVDKQEVAILVFSDETTLLTDFTDNIDDLVAAINSIQLGFPSTDLYGSIIEAVSLWNDSYSIDLIQQGFLVALTDGDDTQGSHTLSQALNAIGNKRSYMIGLGDEINPDALEQLANPGPFYNPNQANELIEIFSEIQNDIVKYANSFYWMNYMSPKREGNHSLRLEVINNANTGNDSYISGNFHASDFYSVYSGVYVNANDSYPYGKDTIFISLNDTTQLKAVTYWAYESPLYEWSTNSIDRIEIIENELDNSKIGVIAREEYIENTTVTVNDIVNGYTKVVTVEIGSPITDFEADTQNGNVPLTVYFIDLSSKNPTSWHWDFGDGGTSTEQNPNHVYVDAGVYTVSLTASNQYGQNVETKNNYINVTGIPVADFTANPVSGLQPLVVNFTDLSINIPTSWHWDFGDGETSTEQNPNHTYLEAGVYTVSLTASNQYGQNVEIKNNYINVLSGAPIADFIANPVSGLPPLVVNFTDLSGNIPTSWHWDFGDGGTSIEQNPSHTYNSGGTYTVKLTATNSNGNNTMEKTDYINIVDLGSFTDPRDNQTYNTVIIGEQEWFAENLNYETSNSACYDHNSNNCDDYGRLYPWSSASIACPDGWHLPTDNEWKELEMYLGMSQSQANQTGWRGTIEGEKLKSTTGWDNNGNGTDEVGFSALPAGSSANNTIFEGIGIYCYWWTATESGIYSWNRNLNASQTKISRYESSKYNGFSVRCVRD